MNIENTTAPEVIETTAPISIVDLKKYFGNKDLTYNIDYANSSLKGATLLTYLSNLDLPCDISGFTNKEETESLLLAYMKSPFIVHVPALEQLALRVLFEHKGLVDQTEFTSFITENADIVARWSGVLSSCLVYNLYIVNAQEIKDQALNYPHNDSQSMEGVNFVNLLKYDEFYAFYGALNEADLQFHDHYFTNSVFKGEGLYKYWANEHNPLFLLTFGIAEGLVNPTEFTEIVKQDHTLQNNLEKNNAAPI